MVRTANRLIHETSPYLLQHAENPVDWYPWGQEAFDRARTEDKPVFVSIGYSACHWCHVMEQESYQDPQIASLLNAFFISVKVDREERPDLDAIYMDVAQAMTGSGGWPLSIFMTPDGKPFFCGTYFPPKDAAGRLGFANLLPALHDVWVQRRGEIMEITQQTIEQAIQGPRPPAGAVSETLLHKTFDQLQQAFDPEFGGFGQAPKFPQPSLLSFLLVYHQRTKNETALTMVAQTLQAMAAGGIRDHLGGGFHRYCVDREWHIPHFEKMLSDQALIAGVCLQMFQITHDSQYAEMAKDVFGYVLGDLTDASGGFYTAEDADSQGQEGLFYLWDYKQIMSILGPVDGPLFAACYQVRPQGNFESKNILHRVKNLAQAAQDAGVRPDEIEALLARSRQRLFEHRAGRVRPRRDEKIITAWNGLMISALAYGSIVLQDPALCEAAQRAANLLLEDLVVQGRLRRSFAGGRAAQPAFLEDYAFLTNGLLDLYQADFDPRWLSEAIVFADEMLVLFEDKEDGGFFFTGSDTDALIVRQKPRYDGALPSGNSIAAAALMKLSALTSRASYFEHARKTLSAFAADMQEHGSAMGQMLIAADFYIGPRQEIVIAGPWHDPAAAAFIHCLSGHFLPRAVRMLKTATSRDSLLNEINPSLRNLGLLNNVPAVYICQNYTCQTPVANVRDLDNLLSTL
ncbi:MAG: thioredoxin domain-containing protein [Planctomycetaceae bacterium]|nr:thioredoxin domain-containing protein [Planctomycetaceae bacterium]